MNCAVLRQPGGGFQVISTDPLARAWIHESRLKWQRIAAIHALGDIWANGGAAASSPVEHHTPP